MQFCDPITLKPTSKDPPILGAEAAEAVRGSFNQRRAEWEASNQHDELKSILASVADKIPPVRKIVAFACSSMSWENRDRLVRRSATQHSLVLTLRDILEKRQGADGIHIDCYAQDPVYSTADKQVLGEVGITVLNDPGGFLEVDETAIVIAIAPDIPVRQVVADLARPAMMIWDRAVTKPLPVEPGREVVGWCVFPVYSPTTRKRFCANERMISNIFC